MLKGISPRLAGFLTTGIAFGFFLIATNSQQQGWIGWYQLADSGQPLDATIVSLQPEVHRSCRYRYTVDSVTYERSEGGCEISVGSNVQITYLPSDPTFATIRDPRSELCFRVLGATLLSIIAGFVTAFRLALRR
jgi:hypothetical protein